MGGSYFDMRDIGSSLKDKKQKENNDRSGLPGRILIVDDSIFVRNQISRFLDSKGFQIVGTASNGIDGIGQFKRLHSDIDLVTMDISMPTMDGVEATRQILDFDPNAKILLICPIGKEDDLEKAMNHGACDYIMKPLKKEVVIEKISNILNAVSIG